MELPKDDEDVPIFAVNLLEEYNRTKKPAITAAQGYKIIDKLVRKLVVSWGEAVDAKAALVVAQRKVASLEKLYSDLIDEIKQKKTDEVFEQPQSDWIAALGRPYVPPA